jgi:hypothetical protein
LGKTNLTGPGARILQRETSCARENELEAAATKTTDGPVTVWLARLLAARKILERDRENENRARPDWRDLQRDQVTDQNERRKRKSVMEEKSNDNQCGSLAKVQPQEKNKHYRSRKIKIRKR